MFFEEYRKNKKKAKKKKFIKPKKKINRLPIYKSNTSKSSKLEIKFERLFLMPLNIDYEAQKKVKGKYYDFYIPSKNLLIEVDGDYYHAKERKNLNKMQVKNIINDNKKNKIAWKNGFKLIRFWESDINNNTSKVYQELHQHL